MAVSRGCGLWKEKQQGKEVGGISIVVDMGNVAIKDRGLS